MADDLPERVKRAVRAGRIDAEALARLCERLTAAGHGALVQGLISDAQESQVGAGSVDGGTAGGDSSRSGQWLNAEGSGQSGAYPQDGDLVTRSMRLRAHALGPSQSPERYQFGPELARGGVGRINVVRDRDLMRTVVMKTLIEGNAVSDYVLKKFVEEAQITGQLEHPNIVPVHEIGFFSGGEVFFTMKIVRGRTLKDIIKRLRKPEEFASADWSIEEFTRTRLLGIFQQVCMAIGFAHSRGVVHRDIKPSNVMVGDFGETLVLDWGVAKVLGRREDVAAEAQVSTLRSESEDATMMGVVTGTPAYMAPEQAAGRVDEVDARSDIYSLGALLYEILAYVPPFRGKNFRQTLTAVLTMPVTPPSARAPENDVPKALEEIALRCLAKRREDRYPSCREVIQDLERYLSGVEDLDRRARMSIDKVEEGRQLVDRFKVARVRAEQLADDVAAFEWRLAGHEPIEMKRPLWSLQSELTAARSEMHQIFSAAAQAFMASVGFDPTNAEAANELAKLYWFKLRESERTNDEEGVIHYRGLVEAYNRGLFDEQLRDEGRLVLRSEPPGAQVTAARLVEVDLQLMPMMEESLGQTPLSNVPLAFGSWLLTVSLPGYRDVILPVQIERGEVTDVTCRLFTEDDIGAHMVYVPGGRFVAGGDEACASARQRRVTSTPDLFVGRYPVTCAEYLAFLHALTAQSPGAAVARVPRLKAREGFLWVKDADGRIALPSIDREGFRWDPYWPVLGISFDDAAAYCAWASEAYGRAVRLPSEDEWERAARGADGRAYPWGHRFDPTFCRMATSREGRPAPETVGSFPTDRSPYGLYDMAGLVSEYCDSLFAADANLRVVRGGNYLTTSEMGCRATHRLGVPRDVPSLTCGFRVVRDAPQGVAAATQRRLVRPSFD